MDLRLTSSLRASVRSKTLDTSHPERTTTTKITTTTKLESYSFEINGNMYWKCRILVKLGLLNIPVHQKSKLGACGVSVEEPL